MDCSQRMALGYLSRFVLDSHIGMKTDMDQRQRIYRLTSFGLFTTSRQNTYLPIISSCELGCIPVSFRVKSLRYYSIGTAIDLRTFRQTAVLLSRSCIDRSCRNKDAEVTINIDQNLHPYTVGPKKFSMSQHLSLSWKIQKRVRRRIG